MTDAIRECGILVVDDEPEARTATTELLKQVGYRNVLEARSGAECLTKLNRLQDRVCVILLDLRMPPFNGDQVIERIVKAHPFTVGIIVMSGYLTPEIDVRLHELAQKDSLPLECISKPIKLRHLTSNLEDVLELVLVKRERSGQGAAQEIQSALQRLDERFQELAEHDDSEDIKEIRQQLSRLETKHGQRVVAPDPSSECLKRGLAEIRQQLNTLTARFGELLPAVEKEIRRSRRCFLREIGLAVLVQILLVAFLVASQHFGAAELLKAMVP